MQHLGKHAVSNSGRTTSYASDRDTALKLSHWLHDFPRVGLTPPTFVLNGMDTILVNNDDLGALSHGYVSSSRVILTDINHLLKNNAAPEDRFAMEAVHDADKRFWKIRE